MSLVFDSLNVRDQAVLQDPTLGSRLPRDISRNFERMVRPISFKLHIYPTSGAHIRMMQGSEKV